MTLPCTSELLPIPWIFLSIMWLQQSVIHWVSQICWEFKFNITNYWKCNQIFSKLMVFLPIVNLFLMSPFTRCSIPNMLVQILGKPNFDRFYTLNITLGNFIRWRVGCEPSSLRMCDKFVVGIQKFDGTFIRKVTHVP